jgi:23S rRNA pseudouridine1911/1915/1917 synthase
MNEEQSARRPENIEQEAETLMLRATERDAGARLDAFLASHIVSRSRTRIKSLIEEGDVLVEGRTVKPSYKLRAGDEIEVELVPLPPAEFAPENIPLETVFEDEEIIVINKPAGLVVHPAAGVSAGTLANALAFHFQHLPNRGGEARPGIVHRLDRDTSGLIVVAKTEAAHENLADQFRAREVSKSYLALAHGLVKQDAGRIDQPIARDPRHRTRMGVVRKGRPALSLYRVRRRFERFTLLDVEIKTGRTHQIRVHLQWMKHPVVGDKVYGEGRDKSVADASLRVAINRMGRQFLHAAELGFRHPGTGEQLLFSSPLPTELQDFLKLISPAGDYYSGQL